MLLFEMMSGSRFDPRVKRNDGGMLVICMMMGIR